MKNERHQEAFLKAVRAMEKSVQIANAYVSNEAAYEIKEPIKVWLRENHEVVSLLEMGVEL